MISSTVLIAIALLLLVAIVVIALAVVAVRRGGRQVSGAAPQGGAPPATGLECPFCKRRYDPAESGRRCPHCGAATPR